MTAYDYSLVKNTAVTFTAAVTNGDSLNIAGGDASNITFATSGSNLVISKSGDGSVTLNNTSLSQLASTNLTFGADTNRAVLMVGDNTAASTLDASGNTLTTAAQNWLNANNIIFGMGGSDVITAAGTGNQVIYGGTGAGDSTDGNDTIQLGVGGNTVYANGGNDVVSYTTVAAATTGGLTTRIYLGAGDDQINDDNRAHAGIFNVWGNSGADTIDISAAVGDATVYGGNGIADSADGNDTITMGVGNGVLYANSGNDTVTSGITGSKTLTAYLGVGNDSYANTAAGTAASTRTTIYAGTGADTVTMTSYVGDATIYGGNGVADSTDGADTITAGVGNFTIYANAGNDSITDSGAHVANTTVLVHAGAGNDTITSTANTTTNIANVYYGNTGNDTFNLNNNANGWDYTIGDFATGDVINITVNGGAAAATLTVSNLGVSPEIVDGGTGSVTLLGYSGNLSATNFVISGGSVLATNSSSTATTITGADGKADLLISGSAGDTLVGANSSTGTNDKLVGNAGDDVFQFTAVAAGDLQNGGTVTGGDGTDTLEFTGTTAVTTVADADFTANVTSLEKLKFANVASNVITLNNLAETAGVNYVDASALTGTNQIGVTLDTNWDSALTVVGGAGADTVTFNATTGSFNVSLSGAAGGDVFTMDEAVFGSGDTVAGGDGTDRLTLNDNAGGYAIADSAFTNVTTTEQLYMGNAAANSTLTLGTAAQAAGIVTVDGAAETGHTLNINASAYTTGISIVGGNGADTLVGGSGNDTIRVNGLDDATALDVVTLGGGTDTLQMELAEDANDGDNAATVTDIKDFVFGTDIFDITDLAAATLRGTGNNIHVGAGTAGNFGAATDSLFVATNTFAATEAGIAAGMTANTLADAAVAYLLFSNATDAYLARITGAGGAGITAADTIQFLAKFSGITSFSTTTEAAIDASFADWVA